MFEECLKLVENKNIELIAEWENKKCIYPFLTLIRKKTLNDFCNYLLNEFYTVENIKEFNKRKFDINSGGVCDMTALGLFSEIYKINKFNLKRVKSYKAFNLSDFLNKNIDKRNWLIRLDNKNGAITISGKSKYLIGFHFQGDSKEILSCVKDNEEDIIIDNDIYKKALYRKNNKFNLKVVLRKINSKIRIHLNQKTRKYYDLTLYLLVNIIKKSKI